MERFLVLLSFPHEYRILSYPVRPGCSRTLSRLQFQNPLPGGGSWQNEATAAVLPTTDILTPRRLKIAQQGKHKAKVRSTPEDNQALVLQTP